LYIRLLLSKDIGRLCYLFITESNESMTVKYTFIYIVESTKQVHFVIVAIVTIVTSANSTRDFTASVCHSHQRQDQLQINANSDQIRSMTRHKK